MIKYRNSSHVQNIILTFGEFLASVFIIYFITVTFGASLIESFYQTLFFSVFMSVICFLPCIVLFDHSNIFILLNRIFILQEFQDDLEYRCMRLSVSAIIGAWFGALVIPLDWDRWWQEWPISCCTGAIFGAFYGALAGFKSKDKNK